MNLEYEQKKNSKEKISSNSWTKSEEINPNGEIGLKIKPPDIIKLQGLENYNIRIKAKYQTYGRNYEYSIVFRIEKIGSSEFDLFLIEEKNSP